MPPAKKTPAKKSVKKPKSADGKVDYSEDFFGKQAFLTASGQLYGEYCACAFGSIYTFGPTFRAVGAHPRYLAEFWMVEPEIAFCDLTRSMECAEGYLRHCFRHVLAECAEDLEERAVSMRERGVP